MLAFRDFTNPSPVADPIFHQVDESGDYASTGPGVSGPYTLPGGLSAGPGVSGPYDLPGASAAQPNPLGGNLTPIYQPGNSAAVPVHPIVMDTTQDIPVLATVDFSQNIMGGPSFYKGPTLSAVAGLSPVAAPVDHHGLFFAAIIIAVLIFF